MKFSRRKTDESLFRQQATSFWQRHQDMAPRRAASGARHHPRHQPAIQSPREERRNVQDTVDAISGRQTAATALVLPQGMELLFKGNKRPRFQDFRHVSCWNLPECVASVFSTTQFWN